MDARLVFSAPPDGSGRLVFGDAGGGGGEVIPDALLGIDADLPGLGVLTLRAGARMGLDADLPGLDGAVGLQWDANVSRGGVRAELQSAWQEAAPVAAGAAAHWQESQPVRVGAQVRWQEAAPVATGVLERWQDGERLRAAVATHWQDMLAVGGCVVFAWQEAQPMRAAVAERWQDGLRVRGAVAAAWQEMLQRRTAVAAHWQDAQQLHAPTHARWHDGMQRRIGVRSHWQDGMRPSPGMYVPPVPPVRPPCFDPQTIGRLVFQELALGDGRLVFLCERAGQVQPPAGIVVPARRSYVVINSIEIRRADDLTGPPLPSESFSMQLNRQSWTWTFSATFHASARDAVTPPMGQAVEIEVRVNGQPFRLQIERAPRSRRLPEHVVTTSGRGKAAVLDPQRGLVMNFGSALDRTAHQLMSEVLTVNGVGFGWSVDFGLQDWLVPGGVWMHQGTFASALADIAGSVGGYLQPHDTDSVMRVLPLWPMEWWRWPQELVPQIELPEGLSEIDETEVIDLPEYNRIFVHGEAGGVFADLTRPGTAGDVLKQPIVVHPLITTIEAAKARARAELCESGLMLRHKMTLPVLPATGVIKPGTVLRYWDDISVQRLGVVDSTGVNQAFPVLTQSLEVVSHA